MKKKATLAPRELSFHDANYLQFIQGRASDLRARFQRKGRDAAQLEPGDRLKDAIHKWLVRETLMQSDPMMSQRAAFEYRDLRRAELNQRKIAENARQPRISKESRRVEDVLKTRPKLTAKQILRILAQNGETVRERGFSDRLSRIRKRLASEAATAELAKAMNDDDS